MLNKPNEHIESALVQKFEELYFCTPTYSNYQKIGGRYSCSGYHQLLKKMNRKACGVNKIWEAFNNGKSEFIGNSRDIEEEYGIDLNYNRDKHIRDDGSLCWPRYGLRLVPITEFFNGLDYEEIEKYDYFK